MLVAAIPTPVPSDQENDNNQPPSPQTPAFASLLDAQPPEDQKALQFLPAPAMPEAGKSEP